MYVLLQYELLFGALSLCARVHDSRHFFNSLRVCLIIAQNYRTVRAITFALQKTLIIARFL